MPHASFGFSTCWAGAQLSSQHPQHFRKAAVPSAGSKKQTITAQLHTNHSSRGSPGSPLHCFQQHHLLTSSLAQIYTEVQSSSTSSPRCSIVMQIPVTFFSKPSVLFPQKPSGSKVSLWLAFNPNRSMSGSEMPVRPRRNHLFYYKHPQECFFNLLTVHLHQIFKVLQEVVSWPCKSLTQPC